MRQLDFFTPIATHTEPRARRHPGRHDRGQQHPARAQRPPPGPARRTSRQLLAKTTPSSTALIQWRRTGNR